MATEKSHQGGLKSLGIEVFKIFKEIIEQPWTNDELTVIPSRRSIESEEERFRLWAQSMGLMQVGHASLDYRVRDSSVIKSALAEVLSELLDHLGNLASIIFGRRLPVERDRAARDNDSAASDGSDDETPVSSFEDNSFHEARFRLSSVAERLDALYKLAARIRNPRNRPQRPTKDLYRHIPEDERAGYRENQENIETVLVAFVQQRHLLESITEAHLKDLDTSREDLLEQYASDTHWLVRRIGLANARRKQQFVYWEGHAQLLARDVVVKVPVISKPVAAPGAPEIPVSGPSAQPAYSVATSATRLMGENITGPDDLKSVISHHSRVSTVVSPQGEKLAWPPAPGRLAGSKFFSCPYCKVLCPGRYLSANNWRSHQTHDLQPYQCTYEDCPDANRLYGQRQEWIDHENQHRRVWHCHAHEEEFETQPEFHQHIAEKHPKEDVSTELEAAFVGSSLRPHRDCPLCPTAFSSVDHMRNHMTYHLERLALFALPDAEEGNRDQALSGHTKDSNRVVEHRGRCDSIDGDFGPKENVEFAQIGEQDQVPNFEPSGPVTMQAVRELSLHFEPFEMKDSFVLDICRWRALVADEDGQGHEQMPIKLKDAVGRKFIFPFHRVEFWEGMEELIKQAFLQVDVIGPHVMEGHYDLVGPNGEILLPQVWDRLIKPGWSIEMRMWPTDRPFPLPPGPPPPHQHPQSVPKN